MTATPIDPPYAQLLALLASDPGNPALLADTAAAAYDAGRYDDAAALIVRHDAVAGPDPRVRQLDGLIAMARRDWLAAIDVFEALRQDDAGAPALRFNLAWSLAMAGRKDAALVLLDHPTVHDIAAAAALKIGLLHERGDLDAALALAMDSLARFPEHRALNAAISTLALDAEDLDLARATAARAGGHPDAMVTAATLALGDDDVTTAARLFEAVLERDGANARARVGRGLVALLANDPAMAAADIDRGAALFGTHPGSWLAAGWSYLLAGDVDTAAARFDHALAIDDCFAEAQGSLAVIQLLRGDAGGARRRIDIALRLDRESFAGAFAAAMLANGDGDEAASRHILEAALTTPVDARGRTIAQLLARNAAGA